MTAVSLIIAVNTSPQAERRFFRFTAQVWQSRFGRAFFRVVAVGRSAQAGGLGTSVAAAPAPNVLPLGVASRFPDLPGLLRRLEAAYATLGIREADLARAVAAAGVPAADFGNGADGGGPTAPPYGTAALLERRDELVADLRGALEATRARRTALAAARENIRVQLLRVGAGVGVPNDLAGELATAHALLETGPEVGGPLEPAAASPG